MGSSVAAHRLSSCNSQASGVASCGLSNCGTRDPECAVSVVEWSEVGNNLCHHLGDITLVGEWINELWYIQTMEYYSALKEMSYHAMKDIEEA